LLILVGLLTALNSDRQQFHQYQQNKQSSLNSDSQQSHQYQQNNHL
jgi:predicted histidine transporter YuiF (NhaC family)